MARVAVAAAADKKAQDIVVLDVSDQLVITDCFVIASAPNERQVQADRRRGRGEAARHGAKPTRREGAREGRWVLLDFVDVVVHVQHTEERGFYGLDRLWKDCPRVSFPEAGRRRRTVRRRGGTETGEPAQAGAAAPRPDRLQRRPAGCRATSTPCSPRPVVDRPRPWPRRSPGWRRTG